MDIPDLEKDNPLESLRQDHEKLKTEIQRLLKISADRDWAVQKTNQSIKILYKELEQKNRELQKLDQLKSDFVSTVSHELRTPLAITTEGLSLILDGVLGPITDRQKKMLETGKRNLDRLQTIINDLLDISKIEAGKMELKSGFVDLQKVLKSHLESYQTVAASKGIRICAQLPDQSALLLIDEDKIIQVVNNLLNNALKFTPENGHISVTMTLREDEVDIAVRDTGVGIAKDDMPKLFGKFQQFSRTHGAGIKGTGLGLAISKSLVEIHGGHIWAESKVGEGTTFSFSLPRYPKMQVMFDEQIEAIVEEARKDGKPVALMILQLQGVKNPATEADQESILIVNQMLRILRDVLSASGDKIFLYNLNSIFVLLPDTRMSGAAVVAGRIREAIFNHDFAVQGAALHPDFQIGVGVFSDTVGDVKDLIKLTQDDLLRRKAIIYLGKDETIMAELQSILASPQQFEIRRPSDEGGARKFLDFVRMMEDGLPDLVILDMRWLGSQGYEIYGWIKGNAGTMHIPVVILAEKEADLKNTSLIGLDASIVLDGKKKPLDFVRFMI